jgi:hypothetical protein
MRSALPSHCNCVSIYYESFYIVIVSGLDFEVIRLELYLY